MLEVWPCDAASCSLREHGYKCNLGRSPPGIQATSENAREMRYSRRQTCKSLSSVEEHSYDKRTEEPGVARKSLSRT